MLAAAFAAVLAMVVAIPAAHAVHDTGAFELDGDATNGATPGDDWDNVCHQVLGNDCSTTSNTTGATAVDWVAESNLNASIFTGGGSKDPQDVSSWNWKDGAGGLPDKDNLLHSFAARYTTSAGDVLFFGSDRRDNSGDAQQGFWFFQNRITLTGSTSGGFNGVHKTGDVLVVSDFSNGGTTSTITVYSWDPSCTKTTGSTVGTCGDANLRIKGTSTSANCASAGANDQFCGIVNPTTITMPWSFTDKSGTANNQALNGEFYEGGVNLTALGLGGTCFASVSAETRSSTSTTAVLKDFVLGGFGQCQTTVTTTPSAATVSVGSQVTDSATVTVSGVSTWSGSLAFSLCGPLSSAAGCATGGTPVGSALNISNATPQPISSSATTVTAVGTYCWRADFTPSAASLAAGVGAGSDGSTTECFTVTGPPTLSSAQSFIPNDRATVTAPAGSTTVTGSVTFAVFENNGCTGTAIYTQTVPVSGTSPQTVSTTNTTVSTTAANVSWRLSFTSTDPTQDNVPATCNEATTLTIDNDLSTP
ncbi:hypothetical protein [Petropleomorpha daqingensis]|uniref:Ig-like domain-containing protein n=1 Tax=Petropleomorpha daqingensis TaxID=2026353 RepID=A0A853C9E1_9ACTN|nr:hypothetical protein [Petropleomorpha daqingensis]NYJ04580.1 hypothetical protein [Petropleomorpha daqingensis]